MSGQLQVDIISPERPLYSGEATAIVAPAHDGEVGILTRHAPMVTKLGVGEVRISRETGSGAVTDRFAVNKGFIHTSENKVIIITEQAAQPSEIDGSAIESSIGDLTKKLEGEITLDERKNLKDELSWFKAQKNVLKHSKS